MIRILSYSSFLQSHPVRCLPKSYPFIMRRFSFYEQKKNPAIHEHSNDQDDRSRLEGGNSCMGFPRIVLAKELEKINPSLDSRILSNTNLEDMLKSVFKENQNCGDNFLTLMICYDNKLSSIPLPSLLKVLELYADPFNVSQKNIYYMINIGECTEDLWLALVKHIDLLNFEQLLTVFKSLNSMHSSFGKKFSNTKKHPPEEIVEKLLERALDAIRESNFKDLAALIQAARELSPDSITKSMHLIQLELFKEPFDLEKVDFDILKTLVVNLPKGIYDRDKELVLKINKKFGEKIGDFWIGDLVDAILGIHRSGLKPSFKFGMHLGDMSHDYLKTVTTKSLKNIFEAFSESNLLTSTIAEEIFFVFGTYPERYSEIFENMIEVFYKMQEHNFAFSIIGNGLILNRISEHIALLSQENFLKASIMILPNSNHEPFFFSFLNVFKNNLELTSNETQKNLGLIMELQRLLLLCLKEKPIFNYQFMSYMGEDSDKLLGIVEHLHEIIKLYMPESPLVFQFLADINGGGMIGTEDFNVKVDLNNFLLVSKSLWKYKLDPGAFKNVIAFIESQKDSGVDLTEGLYYVLSSYKGKLPVNFANVRPTSPFYLSLCFELGAVHGDLSEIEKGLAGFSLHGEELVKMLIVCIENQIFLDRIKKITSNLSFIPRDKMNISIELISRLITSLTLSQCQIEYYAYSLFISKYYSKLGEKLQKTVKDHLLPHSKELSNDFLNLIPRTIPEEQILSPNEIELNQKLGELSQFTEFAIFNPTLLQQIFEDIDKTTDKTEAKALISCTLKYLCIVGNLEKDIRNIFKLVEKHEILEELSLEDLENYYFLVKNSQYQLGKVSEIHSQLKSSLEIPVNNELLLNEKLNLRFYKPFKYETEYETRYLVSNKLPLTSEIRKHFECDEEEVHGAVLRKIKQLHLRKYLALPESQDNFQYLSTYFNKVSKKKSVIKGIKIVTNLAINLLNLKIRENQFKSLYSDFALLLDLTVVFERSKLGILVLDQRHFVKDTSGNTLDIQYPFKVLVNQLEKLTGLKFYTLNSEDITETKTPETHVFMALLKKNNKP